ncbi:hypothetical protein ES705_10631 [subsurface metagenome]
MSKKPIINFNVPKAGRITTGRVIGVAVSAAIIVAVWNWSEQIPQVGKYAALGKYYISRVLGNPYALKPVI